MANISKQMLKIWREERDEVLLSYDVDRFKEFYHKWEKKGFYEMPLPADDIIEISMRKMVCELASATDAQKAEAAEWLTSRGYKPGWTS